MSKDDIRLDLTTEIALELKPHETRRIYFWDKSLGGCFGVRVSPSGHRSWVVIFRKANGKQRQVTLGNVRRLEADLARKAARQLLKKAKLDRVGL